MGPVQQHEGHEHHRRHGQPHQRGALAIEDGDDENGDDVVGHGQGREEHAHAVGHAVAEQRHDAQGKGDVGGCGHAPTVGRLGVGGIEDGVDDDGSQHAAHGRDDGQGRLADVRQLADGHLVLDLQPYEQEKYRHKDIVDDVGQRHLADKAAHAHYHMGVPELLEGLEGRGIRDDERYDSGGEHDGRSLGRRVRKLDHLEPATLMALDLVDENVVGIGVLRSGFHAHILRFSFWAARGSAAHISVYCIAFPRADDQKNDPLRGRHDNLHAKLTRQRPHESLPAARSDAAV